MVRPSQALNGQAIDFVGCHLLQPGARETLREKLDMDQVQLLDSKVVVITGAAQGIGRAAAEMALNLGAKVVAVDLNGEALGAWAGVYPDRVLVCVGSVSDPEFATDAVEKALGKFGAVHGLVNNAGITRPAMIEKMSLTQWNEVIAVHLTGAFLWTQAVGRKMVERSKAGQPGGSIINISSDAGRAGSIGQINYAAAKSGMLGMTMTAAKEWAKFGIRSNSICFGVVETPMTETIRGDKFKDSILSRIPLGRWAQADEVVRPVCFLLSDEASYITGQHIGVNGGFHISL
jgi:3-oxoacyl-[acyl-carrier protein] reductase